MKKYLKSNESDGKERYINYVDIEEFDYHKTKNKMDDFFNKYRFCKEKIKIIEMKINSSLSNDNMGIYSSNYGNPTYDKSEQISKYEQFVNYVDEVHNMFLNTLNKDEKLMFNKLLKKNYTDIDMMMILNLASKSGYMTKKKKFYFKVSIWYDLDEYK